MERPADDVMRHVVEVEAAAEEVLAEKQQLIELDRRRQETRLAVRCVCVCVCPWVCCGRVSVLCDVAPCCGGAAWGHKSPRVCAWARGAIDLSRKMLCRTPSELTSRDKSETNLSVVFSTGSCRRTKLQAKRGCVSATCSSNCRERTRSNCSNGVSSYSSLACGSLPLVSQWMQDFGER